MKDKFLKIWYYVVAGLSGLAILYFIIRLIVSSVDPDLITSVYGVFDIIAIIFLSLAFLMLILIIFIVKYLEVRVEKKAKIKAQDAERLEKYKKRRM